MAKTVTLADGTKLPALGMGTWNMGDTLGARMTQELESLRYGVDAGITLIDTAEMYGDGRSEALVGEAIYREREKVFLVSKVLPNHASGPGVAEACRNSLRRLGTEYMDLYLLHWCGSVPLVETVAAFRKLKQQGLIKHWGVSNFDVEDIEELERCINPGECAVNQILYSLEHRGVEYDLLDANRFRNIVTMAYSPIGQGGALLQNPSLKAVAQRHITATGPATPAQIALAWVLRQRNVLAIPKAGSVQHLKENIAAQDITLTEQDLSDLDHAFAPPHKKIALEMI